MIVVAVVTISVVSIQFFWQRSLNQIEKYPYREIKKIGDISIREYEERLFIAVTMNSSNYESSSKNGFKTLAGYIFGGNNENQKIAMTSPVSLSMDENMTMSFMVPKEYNMDELPQPNDGRVKFIEKPKMRVAAIRFGGWASNEKLKMYREKLTLELNALGIPHNG